MKERCKRYGDWAFVAGGAEGIGRGFTEELAKQGYNIVIADISRQGMETVRKRVETEYNINVRMLEIDLGDRNAANECLELCRETGCRLMIYVAATSRVSRFIQLDHGDLDRFIDVNCRSMLHMVHGFAKHLMGRKLTGGIILISSLSGLIGPQFVATYAATKAFSIRLAESLAAELRVCDIDIMASVAGMVSTPTFQESNPTFGTFRPVVMEPEAIARLTLSNLGRKTIYIPGWFNRIQYFFLEDILPRDFARKLVNKAMAGMYGHRAQ